MQTSTGFFFREKIRKCRFWDLEVFKKQTLIKILLQNLTLACGFAYLVISHHSTGLGLEY